MQIRNLYQKSLQGLQQASNPRSMGGRLTLEIGIALTIALGLVTAWNAWQMQQILIVTHTKNITQIAARFPRDVEIYTEMLQIEPSLKKTIDNVFNPKLLIWVKDNNAKLIVHSDNFQPESVTNRELIYFASMPHQPQIYQLGDRYIILCEGNITIRNKQVGTVYLAQDVTADRQMLVTTIINSIIILIFVEFSILIIINWRIKRSLLSLNQMNKTISELDLDRLQGVQLQLHNPPSEIATLAQTFNMLLSQLAESWETQRQLVSNVSHELRTPLTIVSGYLQSLLKRSTNLTEYQHEAISTAASETDRTVRLLQDLLDLSRADSGYLHFYAEPIVLDELAIEIAAIARQIGSHAILHRRRYANEVSADNRVIAIGDRDRLKQVLINLIDNAIKYSPADRPIVVNVNTRNQQAMIQVCDRGMGIALQDQARVFDRFYRVDEARARSTGGHGLGLAISKTLVEGMGGKLTLQSQPQEGSIFTVILSLSV